MKAKMEYNTASPAVIGIDIGKEVFHLVGLGADGKIAFRRKIRRLGLKDAFEKLPPCIVSMEACLSAHFVSITLRALGHEPRIIPAIYVKPFLKGQKNDYNDAEAIAAAALRPNLRVVQEKSQDQPTCRRVIASGPDWSPAGRQQLTRSEPCRASPSGPVRAPFATRSSQYWRTARTRYRREWLS
jgi:hypothetical protein